MFAMTAFQVRLRKAIGYNAALLEPQGYLDV